MSGINWNMALAPDVGGQIFGSFLKGQEVRKEQDAKNALTAYAMNPNEQTLNALAPHDPKTAISQRKVMEDAGKEKQKGELIQRAVQGDKAAQLALYGIDYNTAKSLDDTGRQRMLDTAGYISNAAFDIKKYPTFQERSAAWDQYVDRGVEMFPGLAQFRGKYSDDALNTWVSVGGKMKELQTYLDPQYKQRGEFGQDLTQFGVPVTDSSQFVPFNVSAPAQSQTQPAPQAAPQVAPQAAGFESPTFQEFQGMVQSLGPQEAAAWAQRNNIRIRVASPQEAANLPAGTRYITPDGMEMIR